MDKDDNEKQGSSPSCAFVDVSKLQIDPEIIKIIPPSLAYKEKVLPIVVRDSEITVAMADPDNLQLIDDLRAVTGLEVEPARCDAGKLEEAVEKYYGPSVEKMFEHFEGEKKDGEHAVIEEVDNLEMLTKEPSLINLVNLVILRAVESRASDIHIEPFEKMLKIKYRIDGVLHEMPEPPKHLQPAIISRVKIMAEMNIAERYLPQDGHIEFNMPGKRIDIRVATIPTIFGESVVLRLLDKSSFLFGMEDLGIQKGILDRFERLIKRSYGILLVTGPTGSGKTTTLYAALSRIYTPEKKMITIEDPVEYQLDGINQIPVRPQRGLTFASGLRSIVRQDPDIIMVGEIRDTETAEIAIRSALTGHLVFSTLHTNDSVSAITRLLDMGLEPFLLASSLVGVMAQRLVRVICTHCKRPFTPDGTVISMIEGEAGPIGELHFARGAGCDECRNTGYLGRTGIFELLLINEQIRREILARSPNNVIREKGAPNFITMRMDGWKKAASGITTIDEVLRVTQEADVEEDLSDLR